MAGMKGALGGSGNVVVPMGGGGGIGDGSGALNPFACYSPRGGGASAGNMLQHTAASMADQFSLTQV
jgi:hypothetical protein